MREDWRVGWCVELVAFSIGCYTIVGLACWDDDPAVTSNHRRPRKNNMPRSHKSKARASQMQGMVAMRRRLRSSTVKDKTKNDTKTPHTTSPCTR